ncbi:MAG: hypothetical protein ACFB02_17215 [Mastigocoleus sp.]
MTDSKAMSSKKSNRDHGKKHHPLIESEGFASPERGATKSNNF